MGATGSRSSPPTETLLMMIPKYSKKLLQVPDHTQDPYKDLIFFRDVTWDVEVMFSPARAEEGDVADYKLLVRIGRRDKESASGMDISIEILDETGEHTVFQRESSRRTWEEERGCLYLCVRRSELEASSCVCRLNDSINIRCTLRKQQPEWRRHLLFWSWPSSKSKKQLKLSAVSEVASHTLNVGSLSELKAALPMSNQWTYSTRFTVGGGRWFLRLCPTRALVHLIRATKEDDETRTTVELSFVLEGAVNVQSDKMTHTFDYDHRYYAFAYQPPVEPMSTSTSTDDSLVVRCCVTVIPAAADHTVVLPPLTESLLTPLLGDVHG